MQIKDEQIHEELRAVGCTMRNTAPEDAIAGVFMGTRAMTDQMKGVWDSASVDMEEVSVKRDNGTDLRVCVFRPKNLKSEPVTGLFWIHGGGYVMGAPEQEKAYFEALAIDGDVVIVSPDYRLGLDEPYPAALNDCYLALSWMKENAEKLGIRPDQIFVAGESAGGGLAIATCLYARDQGDISVAFHMPLCPMIDDRMTTASSQDNDAPVWDSKNNRVGWKIYLGELDKKDVPIYAAPARAEDLTGMPPAASYVGTIEPFHDETVIYIDKLKKCGINVTLKEFEGCFHGFESVCPQSGGSKGSLQFYCRILQICAKELL